MSKFAAVGIHLSVSLIIFLGALYVIAQWFPAPYFMADGGVQGAQLMFFVDMVLGPFLTLIIYKQGKPGLKFDLAVIIAVQLVAFSWGGWTVYTQRTALVVFVDDSFHTLNPKQVELAGLRLEQLSEFSSTQPPMAFLDLPEDRPQRRELIKEYELQKGIPMIRLGERYVPMNEERRHTVLSRDMPIEELKQYNPDFQEIADDLLESYGGKLADYAFIPIHCRYKSSVLMLRRENGQVITMPELEIPVFY